MELEAHSSHNSPDHASPVSAEPVPDEKALAASHQIAGEMSAPKTLLALMPPVRAPQERLIFSTRPEMLLEQAQRIEVWPLPESENTSSTRSSHLLLFARDIREDETVSGCEMVAYPCDHNGRVTSWTHRFACCALNFSLAAQKLRLQIVNDMATLHHVENL